MKQNRSWIRYPKHKVGWKFVTTREVTKNSTVSNRNRKIKLVKIALEIKRKRKEDWICLNLTRKGGKSMNCGGTNVLVEKVFNERPLIAVVKLNSNEENIRKLKMRLKFISYFRTTLSLFWWCQSKQWIPLQPICKSKMYSRLSPDLLFMLKNCSKAVTLEIFYKWLA